MFSKQQMVQLFEAQNSLNIKYLGEDWRKHLDGTSILTAIFTETAEYLESAPRTGDKYESGIKTWKWWKPTLENDEQNMAVETIDVLHFVLTYYLYSFPETSYEDLADAFVNNVKWQFEGEGSDEVNTTQQRGTWILKSMAGVILNHYSRYMLASADNTIHEIDAAPFMLMQHMWVECGRTSDDIFNGYFEKNKLNAERVSKGYMKGQYDKNASGEEDNKKLKV